MSPDRYIKLRDALKSNLTVGELILKAMNLRGLPQNKLAKYAGLSTPLLSHIISGKRSISERQAYRIEKALKNVYAEELIIAQMKTKLDYERKLDKNLRGNF